MVTPVLGLTLGIQGFAPRAQEAARRFRQHTGLPAVVWDDASGAPEAAALLRQRHPELPFHPLFLRYFCFDLLDAERILWFDADLWFERAWQVPEGPEFMAVRDGHWYEWTQSESQRVGICPDSYVNAGLWLAHRARHAGLFERLLQVLPRYLSCHHPEQTALNFLLQSERVPIRFLDRDCNRLRPSEAEEAFVPYAYHFGGGTPEPDCRAYLESPGRGRRVGLPGNAAGLAGTYRYVLLGLGARPLELRDDGTCGAGRDRCEVVWRAWQENGEARLLLYGHDGPRLTPTAELVWQVNRWAGHWLQEERHVTLLEPT